MAFQSLGAVTGSVENVLTGQARTFYARMFIDRLHANRGAAQFGQVDSLALRNGRTISWSTLAKLGRMQQIEEGLNPTASNTTTGSVTATLQDFSELVEFSSHVELNAEDPYLAELTVEMAEQFLQEQDITFLEELDTSTNIIRPNARANDAAVVAGDVIDADSIKLAVYNLRKNNVRPITGYINPTTGVSTVTGRPAYIGFVDALTSYDLEAVTGFKSADTYRTGTDLYQGEIGMVNDVRFILTENTFLLTEADAGASSTVDVQHTPIFGTGAVGIARLGNRSLQFFARSAEQIDSGNPAGRKGSFSTVAEWKVKTLDASRVQKIHHSASQGANA